jgi:hypothetical protein
MNRKTLELEDPVLISMSEPEESRWGFHQFPALTRLPDGRIIIMWADAEDASETHGKPSESLVSSDAGKTWQPFSGPPTPKRPHFTIAPVFNGEYLVMPSCRYFDLHKTGIELGQPIAESFVYGRFQWWRIRDLPEAVIEYFSRIDALRWLPNENSWVPDEVHYDPENLLAAKRQNSSVLPRTFFEHAPRMIGDELIHADYRIGHLLPDGTAAQKRATHCFVSKDNGKSFRYRSTIGADPSGNDLYGEPHLSPTADGNLICVMRKTDHEQKPMAVSRSSDRGHTWEQPRELFDFGVFPCMELLANGTLICSFGRPGVHISVSPDGNGREWQDPVTLISGDPDDISRDTCGYTSLLPLDRNSFLIAYSDFNYRESGVRHKAILVRRVWVRD